MEILTALITVLLPFIVTGATTVLKRLPVFEVSPAVRTASVRLMAAVLSFLAVSGAYMLGGDAITETSVQELALAVLTFLGAVGGHDLLKQKAA